MAEVRHWPRAFPAPRRPFRPRRRVVRPLGRTSFQPANAAQRRLTEDQARFLVVLACFGAAFVVLTPHTAMATAYVALYVAFGLASTVRLLAIGLARGPAGVAPLDQAALPRYSVIVPLFQEADIVPDLVLALSALDYPRSKLEILIVLETGDHATLRALHRARIPEFIHVLIAPPGWPRTKPRACNLALEKATGDYVVIYDAEDRPHPQQLREAAARFATGSARLACLQAPLRIDAAPGFLQRQFAFEYAMLFDTVLPALARLNLPFPLGGTSNHFVTRTLRTVGGWDPYNVTEDADLGFRLAAEGFEAGMLALPTFEPAPHRWADWLPQRARWVKGYIQTLAVHTRASMAHRPMTLLMLILTLGLSTGSAFLHAPLVIVMIGRIGLAALTGQPGGLPLHDLVLLVLGWLSCMAAGLAALERQGRRLDSSILLTLLTAPLYWLLLSVAAAKALHQFATAPHRWDKTAHPAQTGLKGPQALIANL